MSNKAGLYNGKQDPSFTEGSEPKDCSITAVLEIKSWGFDVPRDEFIKSMLVEVAAVSMDMQKALMDEYDSRNKVEEDQENVL